MDVATQKVGRWILKSSRRRLIEVLGNSLLRFAMFALVRRPTGRGSFEGCGALGWDLLDWGLLDCGLLDCGGLDCDAPTVYESLLKKPILKACVGQDQCRVVA